MAERRMFAKSIVLSDAFLDMPMSARCLYFTLGMLADDDGFIGNPKSIMRQCGATNDDMQILIAKRYVLGFETGIIVIKHWRMNNFLRNDRHHETTYLEEMKLLKIDDKGAYTEINKDGIPTDNQRYTEVSIGKDSKGKDINIDVPKQTYKYGSYKNVPLTDEQMTKLNEEFPDDWQERIERVSEYCASTGKKYKDYLATIRAWSKKENKSYYKQKEPIIPHYDPSESWHGTQEELAEIKEKIRKAQEEM